MQAVFEFCLEVILYPIFEVLVRLPGYWLLRCRYKASEVAVESDATIVAGLFLWALVVVTIVLIVWLG
jgi:hypothetical protein